MLINSLYMPRILIIIIFNNNPYVYSFSHYSIESKSIWTIFHMHQRGTIPDHYAMFAFIFIPHENIRTGKNTNKCFDDKAHICKSMVNYLNQAVVITLRSNKNMNILWNLANNKLSPGILFVDVAMVLQSNCVFIKFTINTQCVEKCPSGFL